MKRWTVVVGVVVGVCVGAACSEKSGDEADDKDPGAAGKGVETAKDSPAPDGENSETPKAPSTGKEMPEPKDLRLSPEQAKQAIATVAAELKKPQPNCAEVLKLLTLSLPVVAPKVSKDSLPLYQAFQRCALQEKRWQTLLRSTVELVEAGGGTAARPELIVLALANLGETDRAKAVFIELGKKFPESRPALLWARSIVVCKAGVWKDCLRFTEEGLAAAKKVDPKLESRGAKEQLFFHAAALVYLGELKKAEKEAEALAKIGMGPLAEVLQKMIAKTGAMEMMIDGDRISRRVPLGIYHLMSTVGNQPVVELRFQNFADRTRSLKVESEISGVTQRSSRSVTLLKKKGDILRLVPPLKPDFDIGKIRGDLPAQLSVKVTELSKDGDRVLLDETAEITILPRDSLPLQTLIGKDDARLTHENIAAWITPNDKSIDAFLADAKKLHPNKTFVGEQADTGSQVKALYDALQKRGVSYVMDPTVNTDLMFVQRTRLPSEVLESTNAQCLEGTILFATLLESIGIKPLVVVVPGHAFVGWHTTAADGTGGKPVFLETTMVGGASFKDAVKVGTERVASEEKIGNFKRGASRILDVAKLRGMGYKPQPL